MKLFTTALLAALLLLPVSHVALAQESETEAIPEPIPEPPAILGLKESGADKKEGFKEVVIDQIITDLEVEVERSDLTDEERAKINLVIEKLDEMETVADLGKLSEIAEFNLHHDPFNGHHNGGFLEGMEGLLIPIVAIVFVFGAPVVIVALVLRNNARKTRMQHETINKFVESGRDIPADLFDSLQTKPAPKSNLSKGLILVGVSVGVGLWALITGSVDKFGFSLIPLCIGAAMLLIWKLENKERS